MKLLHKRVFRALAAAKVRTGALVLAFAVAMSMGAGISVGLKNLIETRDRFTGAHGLADLEVRLLPEDARNLPYWSAVPGVARVERRLLLPGTMAVRDGARLNMLLVFLEAQHPHLNRLVMRAGRSFAALDEGVAERSLPEFHGIEVGAALEVRVGRQTYGVRVVGTAASPEFLMVTANPEFFLPEKASLGVVYLPLARVHDRLGFTMVNDLLFRFEPGHDPATVQAAVLERLGSRAVERVISRSSHLSFRHIEIDHGVFELFAPAIQVVLVALALALAIINVDRLVRREMREIGALRALGYGMTAVVGSYVLAILLLAGIGVVLGSVGALAFASAFLDMYVDGHGLAHVIRELHPEVLAQTGAFVLVVALVSAILGTRVLWRKSPQALLRPPVEGDRLARTALRLVSALSRSRRPGVRLGLTNLARNPRLAITTTLAMATTVSVAAGYLVCMESMTAAIRGSFAAHSWTEAVSFLYPTLDEEYAKLGRLPGVQSYEPFIRTAARAESGTAGLDLNLLAIPPTTRLAPVSLTSGRMAAREGEIVLGEDVCRKLAVGVGDTIRMELRNITTDVLVVGTKSDVLLNEGVIPLSVAQRLLEWEDQASGAFLRASQPLTAQLSDLDFVGRVTGRERMAGQFEEVLVDIRSLVLLVAIIAIAVAAAFIVANLVMTTSERRSELATLWALGAGERLRRTVIWTEAFGHIAMGLLLAVPGTILAAELLNGLAGRAWFDQPTSYPPVVLAAAAAAVWLLAWLAVWPATRVARGKDFVELIRVRAMQ